MRNEVLFIFWERLLLTLIALIILVRLFITRCLIATFGYQNPWLSVIHTDVSNIIIPYLVFAVAILFLIGVLLRQQPLQGTNVDLPLILFIIVAGISFFYSADKNLTLRAILFLCADLSIFYLLINLLSSKYRVKLFIMIMVAAGLSVALLGILHYLLIYDVVIRDFKTSNMDSVVKNMFMLKRVGVAFGWPNILAGFLMLVIPLSCAWVFMPEEKKRERLYMALVTALLGLVMFFTYSLSAWISFICGIFISLFIFFSRKANAEKKDRQAAVRVFIIAAVLLFMIFALIVMKRINPFTASSIQARAMYLKSALAIIKERPLLGSGLATFRVVSPAHISSSMGFSSYVHNSYLQLWAETGIAGIILFLLFIFGAAAAGIRSLRYQDAEGRIILVACMCGVISFCLDNLFSFTILAPDIAFFWWIGVALMFSWIGNSKHKDTTAPREKIMYAQASVPIILLSVVVLSISCLWFIGRSDIYFYKGITKIREGNYKEAVIFLNKVKASNPTDGRSSAALGEIYLDLYNNTREQSDLRQAKASFETAIRLRPTIASNYAFLGRIYRILGDGERAHYNYSIAARLAPYVEEYKRLASQ